MYSQYKRLFAMSNLDSVSMLTVFRCAPLSSLTSRLSDESKAAWLISEVTYFSANCLKVS